MAIKLTEENFDTIVQNSELPVLIDFYADWCGPCKMAAPVVSELAKEMEGKAKICKVNVDDEPALAQTFGVMSIPTFVVIKNNAVVGRSTGFRSKQNLVNMLET